MGHEELSARLDKQDRVLDEIRSALVGNPTLGHRGIVARVDALEKDNAEHGRKLLLAAGVLIGAQAAYQFIKSRLGG